ncbi:hypothetical protein BT67DRAFT_450717 [Trichocladium antarcticum]|uniref:Myb-like DNA-binding domain-containing protein n=1 Tax=Trichocladium antarcticum TaxID=1450529 RepID=A0AAN6ZCL9_9PEZI|nr:hypothetical protein BT67DRAFT_450717 [Trichocladium antarcticum]
MSNNDNVMARFLFAILQQKCLKDIDWNKVAHNPVLSQEITNGHAARMRYSRFRAAMLGLEPQRRNRTNPDKSRASKRKKRDSVAAKKEEPGALSNGNDKIKSERAADTTPNIKLERRGNTPPAQPPAQMMPTPSMVKTEPGLAHYSQHGPSLFSAAGPPQIKQERSGMPVHSPSMPSPSPFTIPTTTTPTPTLTPTSTTTTTAAFTDMHHPRMQMRMLTPCSDSDGLQGFAMPHPPHSPSASDMLHHPHSHSLHHLHHAHQFSPPPSVSAASPFDFATSPSQQLRHHHHHHHHQDQGYTVAFTAGGGAYDSMDGGFAAAAFCGGEQPQPHQHQLQHQHQHRHRPHHHDGAEAGHGVDGLGLHRGATSMFRERELEMQMDAVASSLGHGGQAVKLEDWEAEGGYEGI